MKIVVTGGHLTPGLAVISQLKKLDPKIEFYFFGRRNTVEGDRADSFEYLEIKNLSIPFFEISTGRLQRKLTKYSLISLFKFFPSFAKSLFLLAKIRPTLVLTFGGYVALPVVSAAAILQIPVIAHEQTPELGLANRMIFKLSKLKGVSDKKLAQQLSDKTVIFTGPLLREEIFKKKPASLVISKFLERVRDKKLIYIMGGATGSHFLNQIIGKVAPEILNENFVIHQTGNLHQSRDFRILTKFKKSLSFSISQRYFLAEFIDTKDIGAVLKLADLVISRAGANTTAELATLGKVGIIVPLEWGVEQKSIAKKLRKSGAYLVFDQERLTPKKLLESINFIFKNYEKFLSNAKILKEKIQTQGAANFARRILNLRSKE